MLIVVEAEVPPDGPDMAVAVGRDRLLGRRDAPVAFVVLKRLGEAPVDLSLAVAQRLR